MVNFDQLVGIARQNQAQQASQEQNVEGIAAELSLAARQQNTAVHMQIGKIAPQVIYAINFERKVMPEPRLPDYRLIEAKAREKYQGMIAPKPSRSEAVTIRRQRKATQQLAAFDKSYEFTGWFLETGYFAENPPGNGHGVGTTYGAFIDNDGRLLQSPDWQDPRGLKLVSPFAGEPLLVLQGLANIVARLDASVVS